MKRPDRETRTILRDRQFCRELLESIRQADAGQLIPQEEVARKYGVDLTPRP